MTGPVVLVTRDVTRDAGRDTWRGEAGRNAPTEVVLAAARLLLDLVLGVRPYPLHVATHIVSEPGAPLDPISGRAA